MAEAVTPKKLKLLAKMCSIWKIWDNPMKSVKLKQKLVSKLQEIVATKNLDPNNIFAGINLFVVLRWLETVSSTFQDLEFDGSLQPLYTC